MATDHAQPALLTDEDVAEQLKVPTTWVAVAARRGLIGSRKIGRYRRFLQEDVDAYLEQNRTIAANPLALSRRSTAALNRQRRT